MKVYELTKRLTKDTWVMLDNQKTHVTEWEGYAADAVFTDEVKDWDFSKGHIIYI